MDSSRQGCGVSSALPTILMELDPAASYNIKKMYIYANNQIIAQHAGDHDANRYFYLHDRLGSVRQIIFPSMSRSPCT